jgi:hypothetical protein
MRLGIEIPDTVIVELKALAARKGVPFEELVVAMLRLGVAAAFRAEAASRAPKLPAANPHRRRRRDT